MPLYRTLTVIDLKSCTKSLQNLYLKNLWTEKLTKKPWINGVFLRNE